MLNLQNYIRHWELTWLDGTKYTFKLPTQEFLMKVMKLEEIEKSDDQFNFIHDLVVEILNSNEEGHKFTKKEINELTFDMIQAILEDYMNSVSQSLGE